MPLLVYRSEWCLRRNLSGRGPSVLLRKRVLVGAYLPQTLLGTSTANWNCLLLHLRRNKQHDCHKNIQTIQ